MKSAVKPLVFLLGCASAPLTFADAVGVGVGINGISIDYQKAFSEKLGARFMLTDMPFEYDVEEEGIEYEAEYDRTQIGVLLDYFPFSGSFHITGGLYFNDHEWNLSAKAQDGEYEIGDGTYDASDLGIDANVAFAKAEPYLGIGWGNNIGNSGIVFNVDLGVLYLGSASVSYDASGTVGGIPVEDDPNLQEDLEKERVELEDALQDFPFLPILQLGVAYRF
jgi:hypothetical protein